MWRLLPLLVATCATAATVPSGINPSSIIPGAFIIEIGTSTLGKRDVGPFQDSPLVVALGNVASAGLSYTLRQTYTDHPDLFHGASINVDVDVSVKELLQVPGITRAWPVRRRERPTSPKTSDGGGTTGPPGNPISAADLLVGRDTFGPHTMTGVDKTHAAGQLGSGVTVCILDTGVDYLNPILGGCFGSGCHVKLGSDLVGDAYDGTNTPVPDADPYTNCDEHGTHVSGIVGALANSYGFSGVAPQASLGMYRASFTLPTRLPTGVGNSISLPALTATLSGGFPDVPYLSVVRFNASSTTSYPVYFTSTDSTINNDGCSPLPANTPNLAKYVTVVQRGGCDFTTKYANVVQFGGKYLIIYNNAAATSQVYVGFSDFSSYATTFDMYGVNFGAPGGNILSTFPLASGGIGVLSGTSMSSPFVAGAAAVIMSARPGLNVQQLKSLLSHSTSLVRTAESSTSAFESVAAQGSGLIQVNLAVALKTVISPIQLILNDSTHLNNMQSLTITNLDTVARVYTLGAHTQAQGLGLYTSASPLSSQVCTFERSLSLLLQNQLLLPAVTPPPVAAAVATVSFTQGTKYKVAPGGSVSVPITIIPPTLSASDAQLYPTYSGWIAITGSPASGSATDNLRVFDTTNVIYGPGAAYPFLYGSSSVQTQAATYPLSQGSTGGLPTLFSRLAMGTPQLTLDLVSGSIDFVGTIPTNDNPSTAKRAVAEPLAPRADRVLYSSVPTLGNVEFITYSARDAFNSGSSAPYTENQVQFDGRYYTANGQGHVVTTGVSYRFLLRALKITGDPTYEDQYESWLSPAFSYTS
ncbi:hypothetical protein RQP46_008174 [Phenoliferia psychrophenolica]